MTNCPRNIEDYNAVLGSHFSVDEVLRIFGNYKRRLPCIFSGTPSNGRFLFNALTLAYLADRADSRILACSLDSASLFRLVLNAGGEEVTIPTFEELMGPFVMMAGVYAVHACRKNFYQVHRWINRLLAEFGLPKVTVSEFRVALGGIKVSVLRGVTKTETMTPTILEDLYRSMRKFEQAGDVCLEKVAKTDDPDRLFEVYDEIRRTSNSISSLLEDLFLKGLNWNC